ncbi:hypothetical protein [Streptomyces sp. NPDC090057]|uniref:hypothetical protein n=1 Tax=Streptomyces sp. NPDC090057 TaxID=3365935 RepID=UPI003804AC0F
MSETARSAHSGQTPQKLLDVYLTDHLAGAVAGVELAWRMAEEHAASPYGDDLKRLATEIAHDRDALLRLMAELGIPIKHYKLYAAWVGERIGRLKPNGRALRRSGLTVLIELEGMRLAVQGKALLWRALLFAATHDPRLNSDWLEELLERADQQITTLDSLHDRVASTKLHRAPSSAATSRASTTGTTSA